VRSITLRAISAGPHVIDCRSPHEMWIHNSLDNVATYIRLALSEGALRVGAAVFPCGAGTVHAAESLGLLRGQVGALEAAAHCAAQGWMTIVVGPAASGKTSLVQSLAALAGRQLRQVALTAGLSLAHVSAQPETFLSLKHPTYPTHSTHVELTS